MEICVSHFFALDCSCFSASRHETGMENIAAITWQNALEYVAEGPIVSSAEQATLRDWLKSWGAWDASEIAALSDLETNALLLQFIADGVRRWQRGLAAEAPELYLGDDGQYYYCLGV